MKFVLYVTLGVKCNTNGSKGISACRLRCKGMKRTSSFSGTSFGNPRRRIGVGGTEVSESHGEGTRGLSESDSPNIQDSPLCARKISIKIEPEYQSFSVFE